MEIKILNSGSKGNAYYVKSGHNRLLIECGLPFTKLTKRFWDMKETITQLDACIVSHKHKDHSRSIEQLIMRGVDVYLAAETGAEMQLRPHHRLNYMYEPDDSVWRSITPGKWRIAGFPTRHDTFCQGFIIGVDNEILLYLSDSAYSDYTFNGVTHMILGCNHDKTILSEKLEDQLIDQGRVDRLRHSHANIETIVNFLKETNTSQLKEVHLVHLSDENADAIDFAKRVQEVVGDSVCVTAY